jgi:hypothetical protein
MHVEPPCEKALLRLTEPGGLRDTDWLNLSFCVYGRRGPPTSPVHLWVSDNCKQASRVSTDFESNACRLLGVAQMKHNDWEGSNATRVRR